MKRTGTKPTSTQSKLPRFQAEYEVKLKTVNDLRSQMFSLLEQYQRACFQLVRARSRLATAARNEGHPIVTPTWWERGPE